MSPYKAYKGSYNIEYGYFPYWNDSVVWVWEMVTMVQYQHQTADMWWAHPLIDEANEHEHYNYIRCFREDLQLHTWPLFCNGNGSTT